MKGITFIIIILVVFVGITLLNKGKENTLNTPVQSSVDTTKDIYDISKTIIEKIGDVIEVIKEPSDNLGKVPCINSSDCNERLEECTIENPCICENGVCYQ